MMLDDGIITGTLDLIPIRTSSARSILAIIETDIDINIHYLNKY
jgi:hypothetical protein